MKNGMGRLVFLGIMGICLFRGTAAAQSKRNPAVDRGALYEESEWLSASLNASVPGISSLPTFPPISSVFVSGNDPWKSDGPGRGPKTDPFNEARSESTRIR